jgi:hypothetical protein
MAQRTATEIDNIHFSGQDALLDIAAVDRLALIPERAS